jgi:hypothetical protein
MKRSINFEDLFDWEVESDRHYIMLLERHKQEEWEWNLMEEERNKRLPAIIQVLIPTKQSYETKSKSLAL